MGLSPFRDWVNDLFDWLEQHAWIVLGVSAGVGCVAFAEYCVGLVAASFALRELESCEPLIRGPSFWGRRGSTYFKRSPWPPEGRPRRAVLRRASRWENSCL
jgi:pimeloyl-ACP methyl ester carboxylesterase